jgi:Ca2+-binding RTX toxin-like protein
MLALLSRSGFHSHIRQSISSHARRLTPARGAASRPDDGFVAEAPEDRRLLSFTAVLSNRVLTFTGDTNHQTIRVWRSTGPGVDEIKFRETIGSTDSDSAAFQNSDIDRIDVYAGSGDDTITVETTASNPIGTASVNKPTKLFGENGVDNVFGGDESDIIEGGYGDDDLRGNGAADTIFGGWSGDSDTGTDYLNGGEGNDVLEGGGGGDTFDGEAGNDTLRGNSGNDTLTGGSGADYLDGGDGSDTATDYNSANDTLVSIEIVL